jgi:hypothetical protein
MNASRLKEDEEEFSLMDIILFLGRNLRLIALASVLGLGLGVMGYTLYPAYKGSILMPNITDPMLIKRLQFILPRMAGDVDAAEPMKARLSSEKFWTENFIANYVIKKQDLKDLKDLQDTKKDEASSPTLTLILKEQSEAALKRNMEFFVNFVKDKYALYFLEELTTSMKYQSSTFLSNYEKVVLELNTDKKYTLRKIASLESIAKQFKSAPVGQSSQLFDLKDGGSKFLPVNVQLIALKKELADIDLRLEQHQDAYDENLVRVKLQAVMADKLRTCGDGLKCIEYFLEQARKEAAAAPNSQGAALGFNRYISQLEGARSQNSNGFSQLIAMTVEKTSPALFLLAGLIAGLLLGILGGIFHEALKNRGETRL